VFISYRGEDSYGYGALLHAELSRRFGPESVFLDAESIPAGADYVEQLLDRVRRARVAAAVIGPRWLAAANGSGRLIDDPADWVRRELVAAFEAGVRVIPVLTDEARMPAELELPEELAALSRCQFRRLRHREASRDVSRLAADLAAADPELAESLRRGPYFEVEVVCPYPGMVPFDPDQARFFRGRDKLVARLVSRLAVQVRRGSGPLVVIGPSGVGKSSLLRAGLLPALAAGDLPVAGSAGWPHLYLRPGADPLAELAAQVATLGVGEEELPAAIRADPEMLRRVLRQAADTAGAAAPTVDATAVNSAAVADLAAVGAAAQGSATGLLTRVVGPVSTAGRRDSRVVVVVDQLEELFTHGSTETDRLAMLRALVRTTEPSGTEPAPAVVLLGLRADFYSHCARIPELVPHLQDSQILVPPMTADEQCQAIIAPAEAVGLQVEPALTELLLAEATDQALPQLAHVLRRTFANRTGRTLTVEGYRATGGIAQAVATTADAIHDALDNTGQKLLRRLMLAPGRRDRRQRRHPPPGPPRPTPPRRHRGRR
jgi:hypothetical protein